MRRRVRSAVETFERDVGGTSVPPYPVGTQACAFQNTLDQIVERQTRFVRHAGQGCP
jgi:hypothetical protein